MDIPILFNNAKDCCGCAACMNICPKNAITMVADKTGCTYPMINEAKCIRCNSCKMVCSYQNDKIKQYMPLKSYAVQTQNTDIMTSASGGAFASIANNFIKNNGIVYGVSFEKDENKIKCVYKGVRNLVDLEALCGSKYVHAQTGRAYTEVKQLLDQGEKVLYTGTPCQVAGLKGFLKKDYDNLYCIDIICHGVPGDKWFLDYIDTIESKRKIRINSFVFRDKRYGWGLRGRIDYLSRNGETRKKYFISRESSYYYYFLTGNNYRENCYSCKYASNKRVGDLTIGDFWGVQEEHPTELKKFGFNVSAGISCLMVNTEKGERLFAEYGNDLNAFESEYEKIYQHNEQLQKPSARGASQKKILDLYLESGYEGVERVFNRKIKWKAILYKMYSSLRS